MNVGMLFLHNMRTGDCPAWWIDGDVSPREKQAVDDLFGKYMSYEQDAGFNEWRIIPISAGRYHVTRFTWGTGWTGDIDAIAEKLADYYKLS